MTLVYWVLCALAVIWAVSCVVVGLLMLGAVRGKRRIAVDDPWEGAAVRAAFISAWRRQYGEEPREHVRGDTWELPDRRAG